VDSPQGHRDTEKTSEGKKQGVEFETAAKAAANDSRLRTFAGLFLPRSPIEFRREVLESGTNLPFQCEEREPQLSGDGFELVGVFLGLDELLREVSNPVLDASGGRHAAYSTSC